MFNIFLARPYILTRYRENVFTSRYLSFFDSDTTLALFFAFTRQYNNKMGT